METKKKTILTSEVAAKKLRRMAYEILEENANEQEIILAGIRENGYKVARFLQKILAEISPIPTVLLAISLNKKMPDEVQLSKEINFTGKVILVIDDVSNTGKTLLYALKPFLKYYPKKIQTLVLVERSYRNFPVRPDYVGLSVATTVEEHIYVKVAGEVIEGAYLS